MIKNVFMHTSATPGSNNGQLNPNPAAGYIIVNFKDNYQRYLAGGSGFGSPLSGSNISISGSSVMTVGVPYTIVSVGTSTTANWVAVGLPIGVTPAVGVTFIASVTGGGTGTGIVQASAATGSGISNIDVLGDPNTTNAPNPASPAGIGGYMILRCLGATNSSTTTLIATAPANNSVCALTFYYDDSSVLPGDGG